MSRGWRTNRLRCLERDRFKCVKCGDSKDLTVDHIIPRSVGGTSDLKNLRTLCRTCHIMITPRWYRGYGMLTPEEFEKRYGVDHKTRNAIAKERNEFRKKARELRLRRKGRKS